MKLESILCNWNNILKGRPIRNLYIIIVHQWIILTVIQETVTAFLKFNWTRPKMLMKYSPTKTFFRYMEDDWPSDFWIEASRNAKESGCYLFCCVCKGECSLWTSKILMNLYPVTITDLAQEHPSIQNNENDIQLPVAILLALTSRPKII